MPTDTEMLQQSVTEIFGHARAQDRAGRGHKVRRHLQRSIDHLTRVIKAYANDPVAVTRITALRAKKMRVLAQMDREKRTDTFVDPRSILRGPR